MEKKNLTEILKNCPKGTTLYSPIFGEVELDEVTLNGYSSNYPIRVKKKGDTPCYAEFSSDGRYYNCEDGECMLFPSKEQRDWSKFKVSKPDLSIDTPVMVKSEPDIMWHFRYYAGNGCAWKDGYKIADNVDKFLWDYIVPFNKFDPNDIEGSVKNCNYGTKQY